MSVRVSVRVRVRVRVRMRVSVRARLGDEAVVEEAARAVGHLDP